MKGDIRTALLVLGCAWTALGIADLINLGRAVNLSLVAMDIALFFLPGLFLIIAGYGWTSARRRPGGERRAWDDAQ